MRIAMLNNYFYVRGGSERVFHDEMAILGDNGHQVRAFCRANPSDPEYPFSSFFPEDIQTNELSISGKSFNIISELFYSKVSKTKLSAFLDNWRPDIAHAHNIYGRLTTSVLDELYKREIPVVLTLHDYKLICPSYKLEYRGKVCEDCLGGKFYQAIKNRCHKDSFIASGIYAAESYFNHFRKSYRVKVKRLISPSQFLRDKFIEFGWDADHIEVVPNFLDIKHFKPEFTKGSYFLYLGRLSSEKGVPTLLKAFSSLSNKDTSLVVAGTGPIEDRLKSEFSHSPQISFTGHLSGQRLKDVVRGALAIVVPSEWYENAPMSVLEAMAFGKPVIGARIGGIPEMILEEERGYLFEAGNASDLEEKLGIMASLSKTAVETLGRNARAFVEKKHSAKLHFEGLMGVYSDALYKR